VASAKGVPVIGLVRVGAAAVEVRERLSVAAADLRLSYSREVGMELSLVNMKAGADGGMRGARASCQTAAPIARAILAA